MPAARNWKGEFVLLRWHTCFASNQGNLGEEREVHYP